MSESPTTTAQHAGTDPTAPEPGAEAAPRHSAQSTGEPAVAASDRATHAGDAAGESAVGSGDPATGESGADAGDPAAVGTAADVAEPAGAANPRTGRRRVPDTATLEQEGEVAADYLEELLDICDLDGDLDLDVEGERAIVAIVGTGLDHLVGDKGRVLDALQELTRLAVLAQTGQRSRLMLDIAGYRAGRRVELTTLGTETAQQVVASGETRKLAPMNPFERKVVHDAVAAVEGVRSESEGEEPQRRVVVLPV